MLCLLFLFCLKTDFLRASSYHFLLACACFLSSYAIVETVSRSPRRGNAAEQAETRDSVLQRADKKMFSVYHESPPPRKTGDETITKENET